jgi:RNA 2',3'-cyclic 3'-phosphodiesterase
MTQPPPASLRLFLAVFPPRAAQAEAERAIEALHSHGDGVSWVRRENLHYTLRFLGDLGEDGARRAGKAAVEAAAACAPFDAALAAPGAFPTAARARVLWLGMREGAENLRALARALEEALRARGFDRADKPFAPHLTIGRVRVPADWTAKLAAAPPVDARFRVESLLLVRSTLSPGGSRYDVLATAPLAG